MKHIKNNKYNIIIKCAIICVLCSIIYLLYYKNKTNENFATYTSATYFGMTTNTYRANNPSIIETWTVPIGVTSATFSATGGAGGSVNGMISYLKTGINSGGIPAKVTTTLSNLNPGDIYNIYVGNSAITLE